MRLAPFAPLGLAACSVVPRFDPTEWLPGGDTTNTLLLEGHAFEAPAANLEAEHEQTFFAGNAFFAQAWVEAPSSTTARDGLGPLFDARSCSGCHGRDGRGVVPREGETPFVGLLLRVSVDGPEGLSPDPVLGGQIQDQAVPGVAVEATASVRWEAVGDLRRPVFSLDAAPPAAGTRVLSPRLAPQMIGLGLLEAIAPDDLEALADPDDDDGDGISGRVHRLAGDAIGRFGWKAEQPTVERQVAGAFAGDLGLTSRLVSADDCTEVQRDCLDAPTGGEPEVQDDVLDAVVHYARALAVPARRAAEDEPVLRGREAFHRLGCAACHAPSFVTGPAALPELEGQRVWPYTDLLLHDLGPELSDDRPVGDAEGPEWRTPPLWGLGLAQGVEARTGFLHDGRARTLEEAVRWHGGEAEPSRDAFEALPAEERADLVRFLEDL